MLILGLVTVLTFVPYHLWRWTHRLMGAAFALCAAHYALITKPFALGDPVGLYVLAFCVLGIACYAYTLALYARVPGPARYRVQSAEHGADTLRVELQPEGRGLRHRAGLFVFLEFELDGLTEAHPFTIASAPRDDRSTFGLKTSVPGAQSSRAATPAPSQTRRIAPRLPGFSTPSSTTSSGSACRVRVSRSQRHCSATSSRPSGRSR